LGEVRRWRRRIRGEEGERWRRSEKVEDSEKMRAGAAGAR